MLPRRRKKSSRSNKPGRDITKPTLRRKFGSYLVTVEEREGDATKSMQMATLVIPYSPEYQTLTPNTELLMQVADLTGGVQEPKPEDVFGRMRFHSSLLHDIWAALIALLAVLFLLDVGLRRILLPWNEFFAIVSQAVADACPPGALPPPPRRIAPRWKRCSTRARACAASPATCPRRSSPPRRCRMNPSRPRNPSHNPPARNACCPLTSPAHCWNGNGRARRKINHERHEKGENPDGVHGPMERERSEA